MRIPWTSQALGLAMVFLLPQIGAIAAETDDTDLVRLGVYLAAGEVSYGLDGNPGEVI